MARVELPESRLRARKRRRRWRVVILLSVLVFLLAGAVVGLAHIPALQISAVAVSGANTVASTTVEAFVRERLQGSYAWVLPKTNIFLYPQDAIAADLRQRFPEFGSVGVHARDFSTLAVLVVEREPRALWCPPPNAGPTCYFMDENGAIYGEAPSFSAPVYTSYFGEATWGKLPRQFLEPGQFGALTALVDAIAHEAEGEVLERVELDAEGDVRAHFMSGFVLIFALPHAAGDIFERFSLALVSTPLKGKKLSDLEYLDLRFGDKLYYKERE